MNSIYWQGYKPLCHGIFSTPLSHHLYSFLESFSQNKQENLEAEERLSDGGDQSR